MVKRTCDRCGKAIEPTYYPPFGITLCKECEDKLMTYIFGKENSDD